MSELESIRTSKGVHVSYAVHGSAADTPALLLVHGGFSDHLTNWEFVASDLAKAFRVYAVARRGRGKTDSTPIRRLEDEANDVAELIRRMGEDVCVVGHSYGAQVALRAATMLTPERLRGLILYEPPAPSLMSAHIHRLETCAHNGDWSGMSRAFFHEVLRVPAEDLDAWMKSQLWPPIVTDAKATLGDLRALSEYEFRPEMFKSVRTPVMLQIGSLSPRDLYVTDALAAVLPDVRVESLVGQAHEGMTTAPQQYVQSVVRFLKDVSGRQGVSQKSAATAR